MQRRIETDTTDWVYAGTALLILANYLLWIILKPTRIGLLNANQLAGVIIAVYVVLAFFLARHTIFLRLRDRKDSLGALILLLLVTYLLPIISSLVYPKVVGIALDDISYLPAAFFTTPTFYMIFLLTITHVTATKGLRFGFRPFSRPKGKIWWLGITVSTIIALAGPISKESSLVIPPIFEIFMIMLLTNSISVTWRERNTVR